MKHQRATKIILFLLLFISFSSILAQLQLGKMTLLNLAAPTIGPQNFKVNAPLQSQSFLSSIGGIAFEKIAQPMDSLLINNLNLSYDKNQKDGNRFILSINKSKIVTQLFDWELIPITNFANSDINACFTLFGKLLDTFKENEVLSKGGKILNYHPDFYNTLVGLRLFQQDILILDNSSTDLPKDENGYLLGKGELPPNIFENQRGMNKFIYNLIKFQKKLDTSFRSYLICDYNQDIRFSFMNDTLSISGFPFYYYWRYKSDEENFNQKKLEESIQVNIKNAITAEKAKEPLNFDKRQWYIQELLKTIKEYEKEYNFLTGTIKELLELANDSARTVFLDRYQTSSIKDMVVYIQKAMGFYKIVYLKELSERISEKHEVFNQINPVVWNVTVKTMRYASFFRYCKQKFPSVWNKFCQQIKYVTIKPEVITPTVIFQNN